MGYEPEDLPWEVPLIELGLDSLMAVRIKNRVEYDFDLPPIQLTAVRDANLYNVEKLIEYAIEHRDEVQELAEHQKTQTADEIAREQAELLHGGPRRRTRAPAAPAAPAPATGDLPIPPPPTDPSGPRPTAPSRIWPGPPRRSARRRSPRRSTPTCRRATPPSASRSPRGRSSPASPRAASSTRCPSWTTSTAAKMAQRLAERAEGPISAEDVLTSETIEALAEKVRAYFEAGEIDGFVRTLRAPTNESQVPVFVFHPAGGSTVVYEPLLNRLPADTPMYGFERVEGTVRSGPPSMCRSCWK